MSFVETARKDELKRELGRVRDKLCEWLKPGLSDIVARFVPIFFEGGRISVWIETVNKSNPSKCFKIFVLGLSLYRGDRDICRYASGVDELLFEFDFLEKNL
jgi:hypothetical protein